MEQLLIAAIDWEKDTTSELKREIYGHLTSVFEREGWSAAIGLCQLFDEYQKRIGKYKFDIGCDLHGEYVIEEEIVEDINNEDDEPTVYLKSVWKSKGKMTAN